MLLSFFAFVFYLIISIFVSLITIASIDQSATEFDKSATELSQKSGQVLQGLNHLKFLFANNQSVVQILDNRLQITEIIMLAPYVFGFNNASNVVLCSELKDSQGSQSVSIAYLNFQNGIPTDNLSDGAIKKFVFSSCKDFFPQLIQSNNDKFNDRYRSFNNYDVLVWIQPDVLNKFISISGVESADTNANSSSDWFTQQILKSWQAENFGQGHVSLGISALQNKSVKLKFMDQYLNSFLFNSSLSFDH
jgi:hypothetical protein